MKVGADRALGSMNVHLIVNQIKVQDEQQIDLNDFPWLGLCGAWKTRFVSQENFNALIEVQNFARISYNVGKITRPVHGNVQIM